MNIKILCDKFTFKLKLFDSRKIKKLLMGQGEYYFNQTRSTNSQFQVLTSRDL